MRAVLEVAIFYLHIEIVLNSLCSPDSYFSNMLEGLVLLQLVVFFLTVETQIVKISHCNKLEFLAISK